MKTFLPNLLIFFAMVLCGLCGYQWKREATLRQDIQGLHSKVFDKETTIAQTENRLKKSDAEVQRLEEKGKELTATIATNKQEIVMLKRGVAKLENELEAAKLQVDAYKQAVEKQNQSITQQNEVIKEQNATMKTLSEEHNGMVAKYNDLAKKYNETVTEYNKLGEDYKKLADQVAAQQQQEKEKK